MRGGRGLLLAGSLGPAPSGSDMPVRGDDERWHAGAPIGEEHETEDEPEGEDSTAEPIDPAYDDEAGPVDVSGSDVVHVSRLRVDPRHAGGVAFWLAFDNVRKGIALPLVSTLEIALRDLIGS